jgi:hypothetical protein
MNNVKKACGPYAVRFDDEGNPKLHTDCLAGFAHCHVCGHEFQSGDFFVGWDTPNGYRVTCETTVCRQAIRHDYY